MFGDRRPARPTCSLPRSTLWGGGASEPMPQCEFCKRFAADVRWFRKHQLRLGAIVCDREEYARAVLDCRSRSIGQAVAVQCGNGPAWLISTRRTEAAAP